MIHFIKKHVVIITIALAVIIGLLVIRYDETEAIDEEENFMPVALEVEESDDSIEESQTWLIDIKGEVKQPGVYEVESTSRINDVITLAGGFTNEADQAFINLAQKVQDEMVIIVPKEGDDEGLAQSPLQAASNQDEQKVRVNQATQADIETLPGIGPSKAQAIIDYREENGAFQQIDDLLQVNGIGEKTLDNLQEHIAIP